jgi:hypothetical protein
MSTALTHSPQHAEHPSSDMSAHHHTCTERYVQLRSGSVAVCFSAAVPSAWMERRGYRPLAHRRIEAAAAAARGGDRKQTGLADTAAVGSCALDCIAAVPANASSAGRAAVASWEFLLLRLGCQPHHRACGRRSFWASLLEGGELGDCAICMTQLLGIKAAVCVPACRHSFHPACIKRWLRESPSCPVCRGSASVDGLVHPSPDTQSALFSEVSVMCGVVGVSRAKEECSPLSPAPDRP